MSTPQYPSYPFNGQPEGNIFNQSTAMYPPSVQPSSGIPGQPVGQYPNVTQPPFVSVNGQTYPAPPGYAYVNGQLPPSLQVKKSHRGLVIALVCVALVLIAGIAILTLFFTGTIGKLRGAAESSSAKDNIVIGLNRTDITPEFINLAKLGWGKYTLAGDLFLFAGDDNEIHAFSMETKTEIWHNDSPLDELNCDDTETIKMQNDVPNNPDYVLVTCDYSPIKYAVFSTKDGKVISSGSIKHDENDIDTFINMLRDGSLVICDANGLTRYKGVGLLGEKLWNTPEEYCGGGVHELFGGWMTFWGDAGTTGELVSVTDGKKSKAVENFISTIGDSIRGVSSLPLANGNVTISYGVDAGETLTKYAVMVNSEGKPISKIYDNASFTVDNAGTTAMVFFQDSEYQWTKAIRINTATGQEIWEDKSSKLSCIMGADSQFIWGANYPCDTLEDPPDYKMVVVETQTGKPVHINGLNGANSIFRTENGFITSSRVRKEEDDILILKASALQGGEFVKLWSTKLNNARWTFSYRHRIYAFTSDNIGYLGYPKQ